MGSPSRRVLACQPRKVHPTKGCAIPCTQPCPTLSWAMMHFCSPGKDYSMGAGQGGRLPPGYQSVVMAGGELFSLPCWDFPDSSILCLPAVGHWPNTRPVSVGGGVPVG